jgi:hypothetical protein
MDYINNKGENAGSRRNERAELRETLGSASAKGTGTAGPACPVHPGRPESGWTQQNTHIVAFLGFGKTILKQLGVKPRACLGT